MKNVFSSEEKAPELDEAYGTQQQAGTQPTAPPCNPRLPDAAPVELRTPAYKNLAQESGQRVDWKNTRIR